MGVEKPRVACFICNWAFSEEKLVAGKVSKLGDVNVMRIPCIGGLDPVVVLEMFIKGVDGVLLVGCSPSDCHFIKGGAYSEFTVAVLKKLLVSAGLEHTRLELRLISPIEEMKFTRIIEDFVELLEKLGSSPLTREKCDKSLLENVLAAKNAVADFRLRAYIGKGLELTRSANVYGERFSREEFNGLLDEVVAAEFFRQRILILAGEKPFSVKELAEVLNMKSSLVFRQILNMRRRGMIVLDSTVGTTPLYRAVEVQ